MESIEGSAQNVLFCAKVYGIHTGWDKESVGRYLWRESTEREEGARPRPRCPPKGSVSPTSSLTDRGLGGEMFYRHFLNDNLSPDLTWNHVLKLKEGSHFFEFTLQKKNNNKSCAQSIYLTAFCSKYLWVCTAHA